MNKTGEDLIKLNLSLTPPNLPKGHSRQAKAKVVDLE